MGDIGIITEPERTFIPEDEPGRRHEETPVTAPEPVQVPEREKVPA